MKKILLLILYGLLVIPVSASHIVGGEVTYLYIGPGSNPNTSLYRIQLRLFTECGQECGGTTGVACPPTTPIVGIFSNSAPYSLVKSLTLSRGPTQPFLNLTSYPPCLDNQPSVCYLANTYIAPVELPNNAEGYRIAYQSCCRAATLNVTPNATSPNGVPGAAYEAVLPGTGILPTGHNSSAVVNLKDTALVCYNSAFTLEFSAVDPDNDSLSYDFVSAYDGGSFTGTVDTRGPDAPLYHNVVYQTGYAGTSPLGSLVTINHKTGVISGLAPNAIGKFVVNVVIKEWRNGILIAEHRKDFIVRTNECTLTKALLAIIPTTCDGNTVDFSQFNNSSGNITEYRWIFGDPASGSNDTSYDPGPRHTYTSPGVYTVRLRVASGNVCIDSTEQQISVYPGFIVDFSHAGECASFPINFHDNTTAAFGSVNSWSWNFGESGSLSNTSSIQHPSHIYASANTYNVTLIATSTKGCIDTITKTIDVLNGPPLTVTNDTLICRIDTLQLTATGAGSVVWTPNYMINNVNSATPLVSPDVTTTYFVRLTDAFGCFSDAKVRVSVVDSVTQFSDYDTTICQTDAIQLRLNSNALYFNWIPADGSLNSNTIKNPTARPLSNTVYRVHGKISDKCFADNTIRVKVVPYPVANAGPDRTICFGASTQLQASGGVSYFWTPSAFLSNNRIANPVVNQPAASIRYVVSVTDTLGCPKPGRDTALVKVIRVIADAGPRDTSVVLGQPLVLHASGGDSYVWTPSTWLDNPLIADPVSRPENNIRYIVQVSDLNGCSARDTINVRVFFMKADIYVPTGFTPNGDGDNDVIRPILMGMKSLDQFVVYNRWGQQVYAGSGKNAGWDGFFKGRAQETGTYVWYAEGYDYANTLLKRKGYVVLIR